MKLAICKLEDIPKLGARRYRSAAGKTIAIFRTERDEVFAVDDACPHKGGPLSQGIVLGDSVSCPLHGWCIDLRKGEACSPDAGTVARYEVVIENGHVAIGLPAPE